MRTYDNKSTYFRDWTTLKLKRTYARLKKQNDNRNAPNLVGISLELQKRTA